MPHDSFVSFVYDMFIIFCNNDYIGSHISNLNSSCLWQEFFVCCLWKLLRDIICSILFIILRVILPDMYHSLLLGLWYMRCDFILFCILHLYVLILYNDYIVHLACCIIFFNGYCSVFDYQFEYCSFDNLFFP